MNLAEKYRPNKLENVCGQKKAIQSLLNINKNNFPNLLFAGPAGVGKTTSAIIISKKVIKSEKNIVIMNASDDRGIDIVRNKIKQYAKILPDGNDPFKIMILDEVDSMTKNAQEALRKIMEDFSRTIRFILICNYHDRIIPPIQSRCSFVQFGYVENDEIFNRLKYIRDCEKFKISDENLKVIVQISDGDLRKAINVIDAISNMDNITDDDIYELYGMPTPSEIDDLITLMEKNEKIKVYKKLQSMVDNGLSYQNILQSLTNSLMKKMIKKDSKLKDIVKFAKIIVLLADTEKNIYIEGGTTNIQFAKLSLDICQLLKS